MTHSVVGRRAFLGAAGAFSALSFAHPAVLKARTRDADPVRLAVIGLNGRGEDLARTFARDKNARIVAICDVDPRTFAKPLASLAKIPDVAAPRAEADFRRLLDANDIDAVVVATPDHWHGPMTILACQAGKDVYVEKPACHNVLEGRKIVEAARKYNRVVQVGTQRRSSPAIAQAVEFIKSGALGPIGMVRAWIHQKRGPIGKGQPGPVPEGVDYAMWQGPAPDRPFHPNRFHYAWHWFWNWGTGELGNNGVHALDMARWACDLDSPTRITSGGGKFIFDDDQEVPDTQVVTWEFPGTALVWEHRMWSKHGAEGSSFGVAFDGTRGTLIVDGTGWRVENGDGEAVHEPSRASIRRRRTSPTSSNASARGRVPTPTSSRVTSRRGCATSATSRTASAASSPSTARPRRSPATPRPPPCCAASTATATNCRPRSDQAELMTLHRPSPLLE